MMMTKLDVYRAMVLQLLIAILERLIVGGMIEAHMDKQHRLLVRKGADIVYFMNQPDWSGDFNHD